MIKNIFKILFTAFVWILLIGSCKTENQDESDPPQENYAFPLWEHVDFILPRITYLHTIDSFVFSETSLGFYFSVDNGLNWKNISPTDMPSIFVSSITKNTDGFIISTTNGIYVATDQNFYWQKYNMNGLPEDFQKNPGEIFTCGGHTFLLVFSSANNIKGIFRYSSNKGSWELKSVGIPDLIPYNSLSIGNDIYVNFSSTGICDECGIFKSLDFGEKWTRIYSKPKARIIGGRNTGLDSNNKVIYNLYLGFEGEGVIFSPDKGVKWNQINSGLIGTYVRQFAVSTKYLFCLSDQYGISVLSSVSNKWRSFNQGLDHIIAAQNMYCITASDSHVYLGTTATGLWKCSIKNLHID
jgi:hypothetical protein